jgi:hypothetical protein
LGVFWRGVLGATRGDGCCCVAEVEGEVEVEFAVVVVVDVV